VRKYQYKEAVDLAVSGENPGIAVALFSDFIDRNCLDAALADRPEESLAAILQFLGKYLTVPHFDAVLYDVFTRVLKLYSSTLTQSETLMLLLAKINEALSRHIEIQMRYVKLLGELEVAVAANK
jgi:hypothetical protein